jgi:hypothetical protein
MPSAFYQPARNRQDQVTVSNRINGWHKERNGEYDSAFQAELRQGAIYY